MFTSLDTHSVHPKQNHAEVVCAPDPLRHAVSRAIDTSNSGCWAGGLFAAGLLCLAAPALGQVLELSDLNGTNGFKINGEARDDRSGRSVSGAGDLNADGIKDLIIGAPRADPSPDRSGAGISYVVFGSDQGFSTPVELSGLDGSNGFKINGELILDITADSVSDAGDINNDGIDDVIISASSIDNMGLISVGGAYVVFGSDQGFSSPLELSDLDGSNGFRINGVSDRDGTGNSVSAAGDINGDGIDDVVIAGYGVPPSGSIYVVFGTDQPFVTPFELSSLDGGNGFRIDGENPGDSAGKQVSAAGDVNGDGVDDLIISAENAQPNGQGSGATYVLFGSDAGFSTPFSLSDLDGGNGFKINGEASSYSGRYSSGAGDVNGDGFDDVIIGANGADPTGTSSGASYVIFGTDQGFSTPLELSGIDGSNGFQINGADAYDSSGRGVSGAGDVNGDNIEDLIIAAPGADANGVRAGAGFVVFGTDQGFPHPVELGGLDGRNGFRINGEAPDDATSGMSVDGAGDINNDGFGDLIIGAESADPNGGGSGASYVVFGSPTVGQIDAGITISKKIDGIDADDPSGPRLVAGSTYRATYRVTNTGNVFLTKIKVYDRQVEPTPLPWAKICDVGRLAAGASKTCRQRLTPVLDGQRNILGIAQGRTPTGDSIKARDPAYYFGEVNPVRGIEMDKRINGEAADSAPGVMADVGADLSFSYEATNTGNVDLFKVKVYDREVLPNQMPWDLICTLGRLAPGQSLSCDPVVSSAQAGQHNILGIARGKDSQNQFTQDKDNAFYFGQP